MRRACRPSSRGFWIRSISAEFLDSLDTLAQRIALLGALNSLSQVTLKSTMPGVPDFYQGTEFWDLSLVDPDNRRPVDFAERAAVLASVETPDWAAPHAELAQWPCEAGLDRHLLKLRTELAGVFADGDYQPLVVSGPHRDHVIAFARRRGRDAAIVAVTKSLAAFSQGGGVAPAGELRQLARYRRLRGGRLCGCRCEPASPLRYLQGSTSGGVEGQGRQHEAGAKASSAVESLSSMIGSY